MLLQTNSYIVPPDRRAEHARLVRRFRQTLLRLGCATFEVYEQVGANWSAGESSGRFVQIMRFTDRQQQMAVQQAERHDPAAQAVIAEFCDLINFSAQQQQGLFALGFYTSVLSSSTRKLGADEVDPEPAEQPPLTPPPPLAPPAPQPAIAAVAPVVQAGPALAPAEPPRPPSPPIARPSFEDSTATAGVLSAASPVAAAANDTPALDPAEPMSAESFESMLELDLETDGNGEPPSKFPASTDPDRSFGEESPAATPFAEAHDPLDPSADFEDLLNVTADVEPAPHGPNHRHSADIDAGDDLTLEGLDLDASDVDSPKAEPLTEDHTAGHTPLGENHNGHAVHDLLDEANDSVNDPLPSEHRVQH